MRSLHEVRPLHRMLPLAAALCLSLLGCDDDDGASAPSDAAPVTGDAGLDLDATADAAPLPAHDGSLDTPADASDGDASGADTAAAADTGTAPADAALPVQRGPLALTVSGDPNGLYWDGARGQLLLADDDGNRILRWTDRDGFSAIGTLPPAPDRGPGLGQVLPTADGTLVVPRFGYGTQGDVAFLRPDGTNGVVPGLDRTRRRIGLASASDGSLFVGYFVSAGANQPKFGAVARLSLTGGETEFVSGLEKPVGILVMGQELFIADQDRREILKTPLAGPVNLVLHARVESADLLAAGPDGSLFTGGRAGRVYRIGRDGSVNVVAADMREARGVAYDAANRRLFVADHDGSQAATLTHYLRIFPVEP